MDHGVSYNNKERHGLAVGKFYPPHRGHHYLIDTAVAECDTVTVAVCYSSVENISVGDRQTWIEDRHPNVRTIAVKDDTPVLYTDQTWGWFLDALMESLDARNVSLTGGNHPYPNIVYSGESYALEFARRLTARYDDRVFRAEFPERVEARIMDRSVVGTSASLFRDDPAGNWDLLAPATRAGLCKRVVVLGAESSGTTTLAKSLATSFKTTVVPEYGRYFDWAVGKHHEWKPEDFNHIAVMQRLWEDKLARESQNGLLVCDTNEWATEMFSLVYIEDSNWGVREAAEDAPADLYLVTNHNGVKFEDDGTRFNSGQRPWMTDWLLDHLPIEKTFLLSGDPGRRLDDAVAYTKEILKWDIATPLEYREESEQWDMTR